MPTSSGPYRIMEAINPVTFRLDLPPAEVHRKVHNAFHAILLKPCHEDVVFKRLAPAPPPVVLSDGSVENEVERVLLSLLRPCRPQYFVRWKGYGDSGNSSLSGAELRHSPELVQDFVSRGTAEGAGDVKVRPFLVADSGVCTSRALLIPSAYSAFTWSWPGAGTRLISQWANPSQLIWGRGFASTYFRSIPVHSGVFSMSLLESSRTVQVRPTWLVAIMEPRVRGDVPSLGNRRRSPAAITQQCKNIGPNKVCGSMPCQDLGPTKVCGSMHTFPRPPGHGNTIWVARTCIPGRYAAQRRGTTP